MDQWSLSPQTTTGLDYLSRDTDNSYNMTDSKHQNEAEAEAIEVKGESGHVAPPTKPVKINQVIVEEQLVNHNQADLPSPERGSPTLYMGSPVPTI